MAPSAEATCDDCRTCNPELDAARTFFSAGAFSSAGFCEFCGHKRVDHWGRLPSLRPTGSPEPGSSPSGGPPVQALVRVIPVAKALLQRNGAELFLETVAIYTSGLEVRCSKFSAEWGRPSMRDAMERRSEWTISDDAQTPYRVSGSGASGSGGRESTRVSFKPAPDSTATVLTLVFNDQVVEIDLRSGVASH